MYRAWYSKSRLYEKKSSDQRNINLTSIQMFDSFHQATYWSPPLRLMILQSSTKWVFLWYRMYMHSSTIMRMASHSSLLLTPPRVPSGRTPNDHDLGTFDHQSDIVEGPLPPTIIESCR